MNTYHQIKEAIEATRYDYDYGRNLSFSVKEVESLIAIIDELKAKLAQVEAAYADPMQDFADFPGQE